MPQQSGGVIPVVVADVDDFLLWEAELAAALPAGEGIVAPSIMPGGPQLLGRAIVAQGWSVQGQPALMSSWAVANDQLVGLLAGGMYAPVGELRQVLRRVEALARRIRAVAPESAAGPDLMPSPGGVAASSGATLATAVARLAVWQRQHHREVHAGLAVAEGREGAATVGTMAATAGALTETVRAVRIIVDNLLPEAVRDLTLTIRQLRVAQQAANAEQTRELTQTARELAQRIGDVVHWLKTEALPDLEEQIRAEKSARQQAMAAVNRALATETETRTDADLSLATQLAPLAAWAAGFGLHTTDKVRRAETPIDRMMTADLSALLALTSFPGLVALTSRILPEVIGSTPRILGSLDDMARTALGAIT